MSAKGIHGLVLAGGKSERMGRDKALIVYHGQPQYAHLSNLLSAYCDNVYVSCNASQEFFSVPVIKDDPSYADMGPIAGLMTAMEKHEGPWIVIAVDYPQIGKNEIENLIKQRNREAIATVYYNSQTGFYESFIGIYEASFRDIMKQEMLSGRYSVQEILRTHYTEQLVPENLEILRSIDTPESYKTFIQDHENT